MIAHHVSLDTHIQYTCRLRWSKRAGKIANRLEGGGRVRRVARLDPGSEDFDCKKSSILASSGLQKTINQLSIPEGPQRPRLLIHLIHPRVRWRPTGRGVPTIVPRVHDGIMDSTSARKTSIKSKIQSTRQKSLVEGVAWVSQSAD